MKYLFTIILLLVIICGCYSPRIEDNGGMSVYSVRSYNTSAGRGYKYIIMTDTGSDGQESYFITYSPYFYPTGTVVSIHFGEGWMRKPPNVDL